MRWRKCKLTAAVLVVLAVALPAPAALAQGGTPSCNVDPLIPCGPLPWSLPQMPAFRSPTPYTPQPTNTFQVVTPTPSFTPTASPTHTATPTATLGDFAATAGTQVGAGIEVVGTISTPGTIAWADTPVSIETPMQEFASYIGTFLGYARGLQMFNVRGTGGVVGFMLAALIFVILIIAITAMIPVTGVIIRWTVKVIEVIADYIPL